MTHIFTAKPRKWGNSIGIIIPAEVIKSEKINLKKQLTVTLMPQDSNDLRAMAGSLPKKFWGKKTTQQLLDEGDEGEDE